MTWFNIRSELGGVDSDPGVLSLGVGSILVDDSVVVSGECG